MSPGSSRNAAQKKSGGAQRKAQKGQKKKQEFQEQDDYDSAEKGTIPGLRELQGDAIDYLQRGQLNKLIKSMSLIIQEKEKVDHQIKLSWSDEFWLRFLCIYTGFMEGMIPFPLLRKRKVGFTAIPVIGNSVQMLFSPIIMVGIPKWIRCPPSVMRGLWWSWFTLTLTAYIPFLGTYRYANRAPITKVNARLSTYLLLRRLLSESEPIEIEKKRYGKSQRVYKSKHLTEYLGTEVVYSKALHKDISGEWTSCCSCLW